MEGQSVRSRTTSHSPSPSSHSASASVSSSLHNKRKLDEHLPSNFPYSYSDTNKDDELESMSARRGGGGDSEFENDSEDVVVEDDDDPDADIGDEEEEEDNDDSMRVFTNARLENNSRKTKIKMENSLLKIDSDIQKLTASNVLAPVVGLGPGVKEILTENLQASGAYSAREESLKREEETGRLKFVCYANDGIDQHMIWLIGLKNIFARQLPNMPKEYIVRLVMDRSHKSVMVIRHNHVVGGITFRPYVSQKFGEIAFLAITADEQVKGYGTRLMNHLKQHARDVDGLTHFLTYADNNAVGYFIKQGFTKEINLDKDRWQGYIKEYDGGILMECRIDPKLPYTDLSTMIRQQRQAIDEKIRELSNCHIVYPGIDFQKKEAGIPKKIIKVEDIPGLREAGWTPDQWGHSRYKTLNSSADSTDFRQSLITFMRTLLKMMHDHPDAWPFKEPVDPRDVPDYYDVIKDPMDLRTMSKRLESEQYYLTLEMFIADVKRMCANARTYNSPETIYYKCATRLENFFNMKIQAGLQACSKVQQ
ncbi:hypothetical protein C5167_011803 [Papaver somniferum]|uniref:histone acetyltransferase GCN5-like n=1 Tax=Papaver somniferum TaxID=3469 RepID=UPI000E6FFCCC|nr:histone acetyltransferase GCN5-like [Papaver somniferum]RZC92720.1 hypothetical protein C5167_011803 [Papaver somniferum]